MAASGWPRHGSVRSARFAHVHSLRGIQRFGLLRVLRRVPPKCQVLSARREDLRQKPLDIAERVLREPPSSYIVTHLGPHRSIVQFRKHPAFSCDV